MKVVNKKAVIELEKIRLAQKIIPLTRDIFRMVGEKPGILGKIAVKLDSLESRLLDRNKGIYKSLHE